MLTDPKHSVRSVCFSADGDLLVSGSGDNTLKIWSKGSSGTFECKSTLRVDAGEGVLSVSFSPEDNVIAAGCSNGKIYLLDAFAGEVKSTLRGDKQVHCVSFSPDGDMLAAGDGDYPRGNVRLYDVQTGEVKSTLAGHRYVPSPCIECLLL